MRNEHEPFGSSKSNRITLLLHPTKHARSESIVAASLVSETHLPNVTEGPKSARTRAFDLFNKAEVLTRFTLPPRTCSLLTQLIYDEAKGAAPKGQPTVQAKSQRAWFCVFLGSLQIVR